MSFFKKYKIPITIIVILLLLSFSSIKDRSEEHFADLKESMHNIIICDPKYLYLKNPTKCFSCEIDLINRRGIEYAWAAQPSKCYSCERELEKIYGTQYGAIGNPSKCLSCTPSCLKKC